MTLFTIGPLHITGISGSSRTRLIDITLIPALVRTGVMRPLGLFEGRSVSPKTFAMLGPVKSASRTPTSYPSLRSWTASMLVTKDFPTPPLPDIIATMIDDADADLRVKNSAQTVDNRVLVDQCFHPRRVSPLESHGKVFTLSFSNDRQCSRGACPTPRVSARGVVLLP